MAKTKAASPKKGTKAKAVVTPTATPGRTARQTVQSQKKVDAERSVTPASVAKETSPAKVTKRTAIKKSPHKSNLLVDSPARRTRSQSKHVPEQVSETEDDLELPAAKSKAIRSPAKLVEARKTPVKKLPAKSPATRKSPGRPRGRPRKDVSANAEVEHPPDPKVISSGRRKASETQGEDSDVNDHGWTDSPKKKKSPTKRARKALTEEDDYEQHGSAFADDVTDDECGRMTTRLASVGGVRKSIEIRSPSRNRKSRSKSPVRSPVKRSVSKSPVRKASTVAPPDPADVASATSPRRGRPQGAAVRKENTSRSRTRSPAKSKASPTRNSKGAAAAQAPRVSRRLASASPELDEVPNIHVPKARVTSSATKASQSPPKRARSVSPVKQVNATSKQRKQTSTTKPRAGSISSPRPEPSTSREGVQRRRPSSQSQQNPLSSLRYSSTLEEAVSIREKNLRTLEHTAYTSGRDAARKKLYELFGDGDTRDANLFDCIERGVRRRNRQNGIRSISGGKDQRLGASERYYDSVSAGSTGRKLSRTPSRKPSAAEEAPSPRKTITARGGTPNTSNTSMAGKISDALQEGQPSAPGRGTVHSATNPQFIEGVDQKTKPRKNPFFETMPGIEIWHRRMPPYFPFGDTPRMEQLMSQQINNDLSKDNQDGESTSVLNKIKNFVVGEKPREEPAPWPWRLPQVETAEVKKFAKQIQPRPSTTAAGQKRKASGSGPTSPNKRQRGSFDSDATSMSGGLGD